MPAHLRDVVGFLDQTLEIERFRDYAPNGLQVEGALEVERVVTGVSASVELISRAIEVGADLIVVHHGLVWGGGLTKIAGPMRQRLKLLLGNDVSLAAYHLPLEKHARLGNNAGIADALGLEGARTAFGDVRGTALGLAGTWEQPVGKGDAIAKIGAAVGGVARFVFPYGPEQVKKVGVCSGAASDLLEAAAQAGCDLFVTGEPPSAPATSRRSCRSRWSRQVTSRPRCSARCGSPTSCARSSPGSTRDSSTCRTRCDAPVVQRLAQHGQHVT